MNYVFTKHLIYRMQKRHLSEEEVIDTIKNPETITKRHGKYYAQKNIDRGIIEVVYERTERYISIITVYWL